MALPRPRPGDAPKTNAESLTPGLQRLLFVVEQPLFAPAAAAVAAERAVGADHPVTRDHDRELVLPVDAADGADGAWRSDAAGHVGVRPGLAVWNLAERVPRGELERRAALGQRQVE